MISNNYKYHAAIDEYIFMVKSNQVESNEDIKKMISLVEDKLSQYDVWLDNEKIDKAIEKINQYFDFGLLPWEKFIIGLNHAYYSDGSLVWDQYLIMCGRGAGKNGFISALSFYFTTSYHGIKEYNIDIVANCEKQAKTSFDDVYNVIDSNKKLQKAFRYTKEEIVFKKTRSYIKFNTSNANTKDGLRSACVVFDEIHEYEKYDTLKVFISGLGKKKHSRIFYITTNGYVRGGVLDDYLEKSKAILNRENTKSRMLPILYHLESKDEVTDFKKWEKANPSIRYLNNLRLRMEQEYEEALTQPSLMLEFMTKRMNLPSQDTYIAVAEWEKIMATNQPIPDLKGWSCIGAIDYSSIRDFTGVGLLFKNGDKRIWLHHTFICHKALEIPGRKIKFDIELAKEKGLCTILKTDSIDPEKVAEWFLKQSEKYNIINIYADDFRRSILKDTFSKYGLPLDKVRSGPITHTLIYPLMEKLFADENIIFGDDPMMRWYTNNVYVETDKKGNKTFLKIEPILRKTDGFFAFMHALSKDEEIPQYIKPVIFDCYTY